MITLGTCEDLLLLLDGGDSRFNKMITQLLAVSSRHLSNDDGWSPIKGFRIPYKWIF